MSRLYRLPWAAGRDGRDIAEGAITTAGLVSQTPRAAQMWVLFLPTLFTGNIVWVPREWEWEGGFVGESPCDMHI